MIFIFLIKELYIFAKFLIYIFINIQKYIKINFKAQISFLSSYILNSSNKKVLMHLILFLKNEFFKQYIIDFF